MCFINLRNSIKNTLIFFCAVWYKNGIHDIADAGQTQTLMRNILRGTCSAGKFRIIVLV